MAANYNRPPGEGERRRGGGPSSPTQQQRRSQQQQQPPPNPQLEGVNPQLSPQAVMMNAMGSSSTNPPATSTSSQQVGREQVRVSPGNKNMEYLQGQQSAVNMPNSGSPRQQQQQALQRSMGVSPAQHVEQFDQQQQGRMASPPQRQEQRHPSPTKRKTIAVNPTSLINVNPHEIVQQQQVQSPRQRQINLLQQQQSPRKSLLQQPSPQSPRKSILQQQQQQLTQQSPAAAMQGHPIRSLSISPDRHLNHSTPPLQQQNLPPTTTPGNTNIMNRSMSFSPSAQMTRYDDDDDPPHKPNNSNVINRSTSMSPATHMAHFHEDQPAIQPSSNHNHMINRSTSFSPTAQSMINRSTSFSPTAQSMMGQHQYHQPARMQANINTRMSISPRQMQTQQQQQPSSPARLQSSINRSMSISPTQMNMEQQQQPQYNRTGSVNQAAVQGVRPASPPQLNRYLSTAAPRVSVITPTRASNALRPQQLLPTSSSKQMQFGRTSAMQASPSSTPSSRRHMSTDHHLAVTDVVLRSMAAIASAVAFCVMITNTVWINGVTVSYSRIAGFRYVAGVSATAFIISIHQLVVMVAQKLRSHTLGIEVTSARTWLFFTMLVDQIIAYLLLSAGSVGVGALVYIPSICKGATLSADYCSRSTLSVVLTLVTCTVFVMSALLSSFKFYQKTIGST